LADSNLALIFAVELNTSMMKNMRKILQQTDRTFLLNAIDESPAMLASSPQIAGRNLTLPFFLSKIAANDLTMSDLLPQAARRKQFVPIIIRL
jgi:hypothetical protein